MLYFKQKQRSYPSPVMLTPKVMDPAKRKYVHIKIKFLKACLKLFSVSTELLIY